jgi:Nucleotidyl transferase AbiEii toxin, Type IV TA system
MLREETVEAGTLVLIKRLSSDQEFNNFVLVGGTALSLQLGHRKSIDIDLFNEHAFDGQRVAAHLRSAYGASRAAVDGNASIRKKILPTIA